MLRPHAGAFTAAAAALLSLFNAAFLLISTLRERVHRCQRWRGGAGALRREVPRCGAGDLALGTPSSLCSKGTTSHGWGCAAAGEQPPLTAPAPLAPAHHGLASSLVSPAQALLRAGTELGSPRSSEHPRDCGSFSPSTNRSQTPLVQTLCEEGHGHPPLAAPITPRAPGSAQGPQ